MKHRKNHQLKSQPITPYSPEWKQVDEYDVEQGEFRSMSIPIDKSVIVQGNRINHFLASHPGGADTMTIRSSITLSDGRTFRTNNEASEFIGMCKVVRLPYPFENHNWKNDAVTLHVASGDNEFHDMAMKQGEIKYIFTNVKGMVVTDEDGVGENLQGVNAFAVLRDGRKLPLHDDISAFENLPITLEYRP